MGHEEGPLSWRNNLDNLGFISNGMVLGVVWGLVSFFGVDANIEGEWVRGLLAHLTLCAIAGGMVGLIFDIAEQVVQMD